MDKITIIKESNPRRCDICHNSDLFDPITGKCERCNQIEKSGILKFDIDIKDEGLIISKLNKSEYLLWAGKPTLERLKKKIRWILFNIIFSFCFSIGFFTYIYFTLKDRLLGGYLLGVGIALFWGIIFVIDMVKSCNGIIYAISNNRIFIIESNIAKLGKGNKGVYSYKDQDIDELKITNLLDDQIDIEFKINMFSFSNNYNANYRSHIIKGWYGINNGNNFKSFLLRRFKDVKIIVK
jgi:hypothetical protein